MRRIGGDEVRESGGEDVWSVPDSRAALVYELELLALFRRDEIVENQPRVLSLSLPHFLSCEIQKTNRRNFRDDEKDSDASGRFHGSEDRSSLKSFQVNPKV